MAIIWMDGPDHYGPDINLLLNGVYAEAHNMGLNANAGPGGQGYTFRLGDFSPGGLRKVLPGQRSGVGVGQRVYFDNLYFNAIMTFVDLDGIQIGGLFMTSTGALQYRDAGNSILWQSDPVIVTRSWQHIECFVEFNSNAANGRLRVGVDSITIYDNDAIRTLPVRDPAWNICAQVAWGGYITFRDVYIWDTTGPLNNSRMQGDRQIVTTLPTAYALDDWVPTAGGLGWPLVSNVPPNDAQFIAANAPDLTSTFQMGDIDTDITNISAVMVVSRMWKSDAGLATVKLQVTSSGDTTQGAEKAISTNKVFYASIFEKDPHTGVKWTPGGVNAVTAGVERTA